MDRHGQAGATTFEYAVMLGLVLFALVLVAMSLVEERTAAGEEPPGCVPGVVDCDLAVS